MKRIYIAVMFVILVQSSYSVQFELSVQNIVLTGNYITFDLYIRSTAPADTIFLASSSWGWNFNNTVFTNPAFSVVEGFSTNIKSRTGTEVGELFYTLTANPPANGKITGDISGPDPQTQSNFNQRVACISNQLNFHRIGRYKIQGITTFSGLLGLDWYLQYCSIWVYESSSPFNTTQLTGNYTPIGNFYLPVSQLGTSIPERFLLKQNYPNPFNPITNIEYQIPEQSFVKASVYDITGKLVEALVNEQQPAGNYSIQWNAASYPSGVYFCRLNAEKYVGLIKMILVR